MLLYEIVYLRCLLIYLTCIFSIPDAAKMTGKRPKGKESEMVTPSDASGDGTSSRIKSSFAQTAEAAKSMCNNLPLFPH